MAISEFILACENVLIGTFMVALLVLILLNVVTRSIGAPIYWVDEAAVYAMVRLAFISASALTTLRLDFRITLLADQLSPENVRRLRALANAIGVAFGIALTVMCWLWMDPLGIAAASFDAKAYACQSASKRDSDSISMMFRIQLVWFSLENQRHADPISTFRSDPRRIQR